MMPLVSDTHQMRNASGDKGKKSHRNENSIDYIRTSIYGTPIYETPIEVNPFYANIFMVHRSIEQS